MDLSIQDSRFSDPEQFCDAFHAAGWAAEYDQLGRGDFQGRLFSSASGSAQIHRGQWAKAIRHRGCQPAGTVALAVTLGQHGVGRYQGEPIEPGDVIVARDREGFEIYSAPSWDLAIFLLPEEEFATRVATLVQADPAPAVTSRGFAKLPVVEHARLERACRAYFPAVDACAESQEDGFPGDVLADELVSLAVQLVADTEVEPLPTPRHQRRLEIVREAQAYAGACEDAALRLSDLCAHVGVCERTLRYAFKDLTGVSPSAFIRAQRLNRTRRDLLRANPHQALVKTIAYEQGFWHLGQFSHDYHQLFGERPSETLASRAA